MKNKTLFLLASLPFLVGAVGDAEAQGTAFTYQGRLTDKGGTASGNYDLRASLNATELSGSPIAVLTNANVVVSNGLFTTALDFGAAAFPGADRWLELGVRTNGGSGDFTTLTPRQPITPTPYALFAGKAAMLAENASQTFTGTVGFNPSAPGAPPFSVTSTVKVNNLNADLFDGLDSTSFLLKSEHCLTNLAELKARAAGFVPCVTVLGYYAPGDGGGGNFYWEASATETANFGTVIAPASDPPSGRWKRLYAGPLSVKWFGATGNGSADDTPPIQRALDAAAPLGGVVWLDPIVGAYRCNGSLNLPPHVTLKGGYGGMRRGLELFGNSPRGSRLHVLGTGDFLNMNHNSIVDGVEIFYPNQTLAGAPVDYGWTIQALANQHSVTIRNVCCPNPFRFIYINADGFLIDGVQGYPLHKGIKLGRVADVPRINNVHFNPNCIPALDVSRIDWVKANGSCLEMDTVEEFMVQNFFGFGYLRGIWFTGAGAGPSYGSLNNFGFDAVQEGILVQHNGVSGRQGVSITNGRIIPFAGAAGARVGIKFADIAYTTDKKNNPTVSMANVGFFSTHERSIWIESNSGARISVFGGQATEYQNEMVLCQSPNAVVRLFGMRSVGGAGPRINNPGGGDVSDQAPISD